MVKSKKIISTLGSYAGYKSGIIKNPLTLVKSGPCQFWLDGKDNSKLSLNGNKVIQWYDKSGFDRHVSNAFDEKRPTYDPVTGRVTFNSATETYLQGAAFAATLEQPNTIFVLYKIKGNINDLERVFDGLININSLYFFGTFKIAAGVVLSNGNANMNDNIHMLEFNGVNSNYWINGVNVAVGNAGNLGLDGITLGAERSLSLNADVEICEVFGYNCSITSGERIKCENYLYNKCGLTY